MGFANCKQEYIFLWLFASLLSTYAFGQDEIANVFNFGTNNRISAHGLRGIFRDSRGFLWLLSSPGLYRFDGTHYQAFIHHLDQPKSIGGNIIKQMCESHDGHLWIATGDAGLVRYNPRNAEDNAFTNFPHNPNNNQSPRSNVIYCVVEDADGNIWLGGENAGLTCYHPETNQFEHIVPLPGGLTDPTVFNMVQDTDGSFWLGTRDHGLLHFHPRTRQFRSYDLHQYVSGKGLWENQVTAICPSRNGKAVYFASWLLGLCRLDKTTQEITVLPSPVPLHLGLGANDGFVHKLTEDSTGNIWIGSSTLGLLTYDPATKLGENLTPHLIADQSVFQLGVNDILFDKGGWLWLATNLGLKHYNPHLYKSWQRFTLPSPANQSIRPFCTDGAGNAWLLMPNGLGKYDYRRQQLTATYPLPLANITDVDVIAQTVYLTSYNGVYFLDEKAGKILPLPIRNTDSSALDFRSADITKSIVPDTLAGEPVLWIGSWSKGLFRYWIRQQRIEVMLPARGFNILCLFKDAEGRLWMGLDEKGLMRVNDKINFRYTRFVNDPDDPGSLLDNLIFEIATDSKGVLWLATGSHGLARLDKLPNGKNTFHTIAELSNGPTPAIFGVLPDTQDNFWLTTSDGLYVFQVALQQFVKLQPGDGFLPETAEYYLKTDRRHNIFFRTKDALMTGANSSLLFSLTPDFSLHLTDFSVFDRNRNDLRYTKQTVLKPGENFFSIGYAALNFSYAHRTRYRYQLVGFDKDWVEAKTRRVAYYTNVSPDDYVFRLRVDLGNPAQYREITRKIHVEAAFWQTPWFLSLVLVTLVFIAHAYYRLQLRKSTLEAELGRKRAEIGQKEAEMLQQEAEMREREADFQKRIAETEMVGLRAQMNPHFIFNCLNSIKLYSAQNNSEMTSHYLTKFARLIRLVLENSRSEKVTLENELEALQLYIEMEAMRFKEKVKYNLIVDLAIDRQYIEIPPLLLQPYVENAIWHGLMHSKEGGTVVVEVTQPQDHRLHVEISDNGVGRTTAMEYKSKSATRQKSFGMKMTSDRIMIINQMCNTQTVVHIQDLVHADGSPAGTKVILEIPV
jgi:ligand-binding sensor domain-containing protein/signal transduction histidine kinase